MHEYSMMMEIVARVLDASQARGAIRVSKVSLRIGELTFLAPDQLTTAFSAITKGTPAEGAELEIEVLPGTVKCMECSFVGPIPERDIGGSHFAPLLICPECEGIAQVATGKECTVSDVVIEIPDDSSAGQMI